MELVGAVLNAISDDYENVKLIAQYLRYAGMHPPPSADEIGAALGQLINDGLAQAYVLSPRPPHAQQVEFELRKMEELWFYVTAQGKERVKKQNELADTEPDMA